MNVSVLRRITLATTSRSNKTTINMSLSDIHTTHQPWPATGRARNDISCPKRMSGTQRQHHLTRLTTKQHEVPTRYNLHIQTYQSYARFHFLRSTLYRKNAFMAQAFRTFYERRTYGKWRTTFYDKRTVFFSHENIARRRH